MVRHEVKSPITGAVWTAVKAPGQAVLEGEQIVILECMKMEIPVLSPITGTVVEVLPDATPINEGDVVAVVESE